jgi:cold shock protein
MRGLAEGQKVSYDVEADRRTGKESATNLRAT